MFSIIIPTFNNLDYLKLCIKSIRQNSKYTHQIIPHVNIGSDKTSEFLTKENIDYTFTDYNSGICEGMNTASKKSKFEYILLGIVKQQKDENHILGCKCVLELYRMGAS